MAYESHQQQLQNANTTLTVSKGINYTLDDKHLLQLNNKWHS